MQTTMIEIPTMLKPAVQALVDATQQAEKRASHGRTIDALTLESEIHLAAVECERSALEWVVQAASVDARRIRVGADELFSAGRFETQYMSAAGPLRVERTLYRWVRNGPTFDPVAAKFGMVDKVWLPGAAAQIAALLAMGSSRAAVKIVQVLRRLPYSRSSFERVGHAVGGLYVERHADIDEELTVTLIADGAPELWHQPMQRHAEGRPLTFQLCGVSRIGTPVPHSIGSGSLITASTHRAVRVHRIRRSLFRNRKISTRQRPSAACWRAARSSPAQTAGRRWSRRNT